jgi:hypothetical protein
MIHARCQWGKIACGRLGLKRVRMGDKKIRLCKKHYDEFSAIEAKDVEYERRKSPHFAE